MKHKIIIINLSIDDSKIVIIIFNSSDAELKISVSAALTISSGPAAGGCLGSNSLDYLKASFKDALFLMDRWPLALKLRLWIKF